MAPRAWVGALVAVPAEPTQSIERVSNHAPKRDELRSGRQRSSASASPMDARRGRVGWSRLQLVRWATKREEVSDGVRELHQRRQRHSDVCKCVVGLLQRAWIPKLRGPVSVPTVYALGGKDAGESGGVWVVFEGYVGDAEVGRWNGGCHQGRVHRVVVGVGRRCWEVHSWDIVKRWKGIWSGAKRRRKGFRLEVQSVLATDSWLQQSCLLSRITPGRLFPLRYGLEIHKEGAHGSNSTQEPWPSCVSVGSGIHAPRVAHRDGASGRLGTVVRYRTLLRTLACSALQSCHLLCLDPARVIQRWASRFESELGQFQFLFALFLSHLC